MNSRPRFASVDAMRGLTVAAMLVVNDPGDWDHVYPWLDHSEWNGCTLADYVFPFFLFLVGVSISLSIEGQLARGDARQTLASKAIGRGLRIVALGLALAALSWWLIPNGHTYRPMGVLQRIGICYIAGALVALYVRHALAQWALFACIVLGYWALMGFAPLLPGVNLADRLDSIVLGTHAYLYDLASQQGRDPEGLLSTVPSIATVLLGMRAGHWLRAGQVVNLLWAGLVSLALGAAWSLIFPINKQLWTSSFVLWTGGAALLGLTLAHRLFDVWHWPPIGRSLGVNAITAYAASWAAVCILLGTGAMRPLYEGVFLSIFGTSVPGWIPSLAFALAFTAVFWLAVYAMTRRGWRITI